MSDHPGQQIPYPGTQGQMAEEPQDEMRGYHGSGLLLVRSCGSDAPMGLAAQPDEIAPSYRFFTSNRLSSFYSDGVLAPVGGQTMPG